MLQKNAESGNTYLMNCDENGNITDAMEVSNVLGTTVESARQAVEKALYDLEHPLEPLTNRSASVQKSIEKEKEFYQVFLSNSRFKK